MNSLSRLHPVVHGILAGLIFSAVGGTIALDIVGFWMGGLLVLPIAAVGVISYVAWRYRSAGILLFVVLGSIVGLAPVSAYFALQSTRFGFEFLLPLATGACIATLLGPFYLSRLRRARSSSGIDPKAT